MEENTYQLPFFTFAQELESKGNSINHTQVKTHKKEPTSPKLECLFFTKHSCHFHVSNNFS